MGKQKITWISIKDSDGKGGVRYREHPTRKHGILPDRYYAIRYWWWTESRETGELKKGMKTEGVGWASDGVKPSLCFDLLKRIKRNQKAGKGPCTLKEWRDAEAAEKKAEVARSITLDQYWNKLKFPKNVSCRHP